MTPPQTGAATNRFESLFEQLTDPVVEFSLADRKPIIIQANAAFREAFAEADPVAGLPLNELIVPESRKEEAESFDQRTTDGQSNRAVIERTTVDGPRKFLYRGVPVGENRGFAIYSDVTDKLRKDQCLHVLQRVLRHNLRNKANIIEGHAEEAIETITAGDETDNEQIRNSLEMIATASEELTKLCAEAQTIRKTVDGSPTLEPTDLKPLIDAVSEECSDRFEEAIITVDCPPAIGVVADTRLQILIDSLLDNAIRHNTASLPEVTVAASNVDSSMVELTVTDNGPGIPETERRIISDDTEISPLSHGSGLGLWLVKWLTESYGGKLSIDTPADGGSIVCVQLVCADD